jgi:hypothetical protein
MYQDRDSSPLKHQEKQGAAEILEISEYILVRQMQEKYGFGIVAEKGMREGGVLGSYTRTLAIAKAHGEKCLDFIFTICKDGAFDRKTNGYSGAVVTALRDMYTIFKDVDIKETKAILTRLLRHETPLTLTSVAITRYPKLTKELALSLYLEDYVADSLNVEMTRYEEDGKVIKIA